MIKYRLELPPDFDAEAGVWHAKGYVGNVRLWCEGRDHVLQFYEPVRLAREIEGELARGILFYEPNLVVVREITRGQIESAVARLVESGLAGSFGQE